MPSEPMDPEIMYMPGQKPRRRQLWPYWGGGLFLLFLLLHNAAPLYTDWLWFREVGYPSVFTVTIVAKSTLFLLFGGLFFLLFYGNLTLARRLAPPQADRFLRENFGVQTADTVQRFLGLIVLAIALFLSLWAGRIAADVWANWLEFTHATPFGKTDPLFHNDIGFYIFQLPFWNFVYEFLLGTLAIVAVAVVAIHILTSAIPSWSGLSEIAPGVRRQLLLLIAGLFAVMALGARLRAYDLLLADNGLFTGAGYTDATFRLFARNAQVIILLGGVVVTIGELLANRRGFKGQVVTIGLYAIASVLFNGVIPAVVQSIKVEPNQFTVEQKYIERNIRYTRQGFGVEAVRSLDSFPADESLTGTQLKANHATLDNVRLWDYPYLGKVYSQLQTIKPYYKFAAMGVDGNTYPNIDVDRYPINGTMRQVMLAARELDSGALPDSAQTWQNRRLGYTHGYGLVMSPVNRATEGNPEYFLSGFPPTASREATGLSVTHPEIYYGLLAHEPVYVNTQQAEFDYPSSAGNGAGNTAGVAQDHYTRYAGQGGIAIGDSLLRKLAFAARLGDWNLLLASNLKPQTRVLFRRDIRDRLQTVAPFVQQDGDPYLIVTPETGRLLWMVDCYTMSDRYPYSTPQSVNVNAAVTIAPNYIRNSVKATVDAYDGKVTLYLADPKDPIALTYAKIFPGLLRPLNTIPTGIRAHLRYPEDLFRLQRSVYATYHVADSRVFYLKEDVWSVPNEPNSDPTGTAGATQMEPYYVVMKLPGLSQIEEFVLMSPLAPFKKEEQNILGWMCARCDPENYGELVLYRFPQQVNIEGPSQIVQLINSDKVISPQLSLLRSGGSTATVGNLLVIPIEKSLLYIAPLYVEATNSASKLPKLQKVIVAFGNNVAMDDTLDKALARLFPDYAAPDVDRDAGSSPIPTPEKPDNAPAIRITPQVRTLIEKASTQYEEAQAKLKAGDFAGYGTVTVQLKQTLDALRKITH